MDLPEEPGGVGLWCAGIRRKGDCQGWAEQFLMHCQAYNNVLELV